MHLESPQTHSVQAEIGTSLRVIARPPLASKALGVDDEEAAAQLIFAPVVEAPVSPSLAEERTKAQRGSWDMELVNFEPVGVILSCGVIILSHIQHIHTSKMLMHAIIYIHIL